MMHFRRALTVVAVTMGFVMLVMSCGENQQQLQFEQEKTQISTVIENGIGRIDNRISELRDTMEGAGEGMQYQYQARIDDLQETRDVLQGRLDDIADATMDNWDELRDDVQNSMNDITSKLEETI